MDKSIVVNPDAPSFRKASAFAGYCAAPTGRKCSSETSLSGETISRSLSYQVSHMNVQGLERRQAAAWRHLVGRGVFFYSHRQNERHNGNGCPGFFGFALKQPFPLCLSFCP